MAYTILHTKDDGIITTYSGTVDDAEYIESIKKRWSNDDVTKNCRYVISDFSGVESLKLTSYGIQQSAKICTKASQFNHSIFIVGILPTDLEYGMARMWQSYSDDTGWESFPARNLDEAHHWLDEKLKNVRSK